MLEFIVSTYCLGVGLLYRGRQELPDMIVFFLCCCGLISLFILVLLFWNAWTHG